MTAMDVFFVAFAALGFDPDRYDVRDEDPED